MSFLFVSKRNRIVNVEIMITLLFLDSICKLKFGSPVSYAHGRDPETVYVLDINNDNINDVIALYYVISVTKVILGKGDGTFGKPISFFNGDHYGPYELAAGDLNHDGKLDIVVTHYDAGNVGVFFGDGTGHFTPFKEYSTGTGSAPIGVSLVDINGDKELDMIVGCELANNVQIYFGNGDGTFRLHQTYPTGDGTGPAKIATHDFNNDGKLDFIVSYFDGGKIGVFLGDGKGNFVIKAVYPTGAGPYNPTLGDFNSDGKIDVATGNYYDNNTSVFLGKGDGTFVLAHTLSTGANSQPYSIDTGDLNNDKILDLAVSNAGTNNVGVLLGIGNGDFKRVQTISTGANSAPYTVAIGDFNNDGLQDLVTANNGTGDLTVLLNKCSSSLY